MVGCTFKQLNSIVFISIVPIITAMVLRFFISIVPIIMVMVLRFFTETKAWQGLPANGKKL